MTQDTQANPGTLTVGQTLTAMIGAQGVGEYFAIDLTAGTTYDFTATGLATYSDVTLATTENSFSGYPAPYGSGSATLVENFTADTTGVYYVSVLNNGYSSPTYTLNATVVPDSYTLANPTTLTVGKTINASIESVSDTDWFEINLQAGQTYDFTVNGLGSQVFLEILSLANASDSANAVQGGTVSNGVTSYNFTADTTGTYAIGVPGPNGASNVSYTLTATQVTDSYTLANPGKLTVGGAVTASIESQNDANWFAITLVAGDSYTFTETGLSSYTSLAVYGGGRCQGYAMGT